MKHQFYLPFTVIFLAGSIHIAMAQSMETEVIGSAGSFASTSAGTLQWTVGEPMIRTVVNDAILSDGFHQTVIWEIVPVSQAPDLHLTIWPNPSTHFIEIASDRPVSVVLFDLLGRKVADEASVAQQTVLQLEQIPSGTYFLEVSDLMQHRLATYKILHINP
jgi:Secretion system C-terminal sorting domain